MSNLNNNFFYILSIDLFSRVVREQSFGRFIVETLCIGNIFACETSIWRWKSCVPMTISIRFRHYCDIINKKELFNECVIQIICVHILTFTEWVTEPIIRLNIGWSLLFFLAVYSIINIGDVLIVSLSSLKTSYTLLKTTINNKKSSLSKSLKN